jgi:hypothetical protein
LRPPLCPPCGKKDDGAELSRQTGRADTPHFSRVPAGAVAFLMHGPCRDGQDRCAEGRSEPPKTASAEALRVPDRAVPHLRKGLSRRQPGKPGHMMSERTLRPRSGPECLGGTLSRGQIRKRVSQMSDFPVKSSGKFSNGKYRHLFGQPLFIPSCQGDKTVVTCSQWL